MEVTSFKLMKHACPKLIAAEMHTYLVTSTKNTLHFFSPTNFTKLRSIDLKYKINCLNFYNDNILLIGTECGRFLIMNMFSFESKCIIHRNNIKIIKSSNDMVCIVDEKNLIVVKIDNKSQLKNNNVNYDDFEILSEHCYSFNNDITAIAIKNEVSVFCESNGFIHTLKNGIMTEFMFENTRYNDIKAYSEDVFISVTETGDLIAFDIEKEIVISDFKVRNSPLKSLTICDNIIYCAGFDSRIMSFSYDDDTLIKGQQTDTHSLPVFKLLSNDKVISISEDMIGVHVLLEKGYSSRKIAIDNIKMKNHGNMIITNNDFSINIYEIQNSILGEEINLFKKRDYRNLYEVNSKERICEIEINEQYFCYSTMENSFLYDIKQMKLILTLERMMKIGIVNDLLIYINSKNNIKIFDIKKKKVIEEIVLDNFDETFLVYNEIVFISKENTLINVLKNNKSNPKSNLVKDFDDNIKLEGFIEHFCYDNNEFYFLERTKSKEKQYLNNNYFLKKYNTKEKKFEMTYQVKNFMRIDGLLIKNNKIIIYNHEKLFSLNLKNMADKTKHFETVCGVGDFENGLIVAHVDKKNTEEMEESKKVKVKFRNKIMIQN